MFAIVEWGCVQRVCWYICVGFHADMLGYTLWRTAYPCTSLNVFHRIVGNLHHTDVSVWLIVRYTNTHLLHSSSLAAWDYNNLYVLSLSLNRASPLFAVCASRPSLCPLWRSVYPSALISVHHYHSVFLNGRSLTST